jgi:drug/metabolite transporter (DMT)-like permease
MNFGLKLTLIVLNACCIVTGQVMLALLARSVTTPITAARIARELVLHPATYGFIGCYSVSTIAYMALLKRYPLAEVTLSTLVLMILMTGLQTYWLGDQMTPLQWIGVAVILVGVIMLQGQ